MIVRILPEAEEDLYQAVLWYEEREPGVGIRMLAAYDETPHHRASRSNAATRNDASRARYSAVIFKAVSVSGCV